MVLISFQKLPSANLLWPTTRTLDTLPSYACARGACMKKQKNKKKIGCRVHRIYLSCCHHCHTCRPASMDCTPHGQTGCLSRLTSISSSPSHQFVFKLVKGWCGVLPTARMQDSIGLRIDRYRFHIERCLSLLLFLFCFFLVQT